jgi:hypothetical protein
MEEQRDCDIQACRDEEVGNPGALGLDERRHIGIDMHLRAAQLHVTPPIEPCHPAFGQDATGLCGDPVRHHDAIGQYADQTLGLGLADAPARRNENLTPVGLDSRGGHSLGRHSKGPKRLGHLFGRTIRAS